MRARESREIAHGGAASGFQWSREECNLDRCAFRSIRFRLPNGLFVTLSEDHTAPIVAVNLWYHVGSANERPGRTGFAHLFEHMLFQGSADVEANEHFELVQRAGGTLNGSTWLERTNYFETVPSNQLELALWLEANRMGKLLPAMTQQKLDTQRDVVMNERRWSMDNQPYGTWMEKLPALCFPPEHPFHHSLIGSMDDLTAASLDDVAQFFATYYTPDNAVLSIAGDFDPARSARARSKNTSATFRAAQGKPPLPDMSLPPVFGQWKREVVPDDVMLPRLFLAFRSPAFGTERVLRRERLRRGARPAQRQPSATASRSRATGRGRRVGVHVRSREGERPARRRRHGATGRSAEQLEQEVAHEIDTIVRDGIERGRGRARGRAHSDVVRLGDAGGRRARRPAVDVRHVLSATRAW